MLHRGMTTITGVFGEPKNASCSELRDENASCSEPRGYQPLGVDGSIYGDGSVVCASRAITSARLGKSSSKGLHEPFPSLCPIGNGLFQLNI